MERSKSKLKTSGSKINVIFLESSLSVDFKFNKN